MPIKNIAIDTVTGKQTVVAVSTDTNKKNLIMSRMGADASVITVTYDIVTVGGYSITSGTLTIDGDGAAGINSIDTGSLAANTWYYVYVIYNPTTATAAGLISLSATAPTMPAGYTEKLRVGSIRATSTSEFRKVHATGDGLHWYDNIITVVSGGTAVAYTAVDCSSAMPPTSRDFIANALISDDSSLSRLYVKATGDTGGYALGTNTGSAASETYCAFEATTNSAQSFDYKIDADDTSASISILAYRDNL